MLEVASESTGDIDEDRKRQDYANMRVPEYWRFDPSGGDWHSSHMAGDRLVGGEYHPIPIHQTAEGHYWGHSDALNLDLCWENGELRWYDPAAKGYLPTFADERAARITAEAQQEIAEARVRELEAQLRRQQDHAPEAP